MKKKINIEQARKDGRKGGKATFQKYGRKGMARAGRLGALARWGNKSNATKK